MSNAPSTPDARRTLADPVSRIADALISVPLTPLRFAGFWSAVVLPFVYVPMLVGGLAGTRRATFGVLLALHALSLVAGHRYGEQ